MPSSSGGCNHWWRHGWPKVGILAGMYVNSGTELFWENITIYDDVIKWTHFPCQLAFERGIHRSPVNSPHKGQWRGALMFCLICAWTVEKKSGRWRFETPSRSLWRHCNVLHFQTCRHSRMTPVVELFLLQPLIIHVHLLSALLLTFTDFSTRFVEMCVIPARCCGARYFLIMTIIWTALSCLDAIMSLGKISWLTLVWEVLDWSCTDE